LKEWGKKRVGDERDAVEISCPFHGCKLCADPGNQQPVISKVQLGVRPADAGMNVGGV
jgi:hypothetical protein